ncbi:MAG: acyltransferase family protein [Microthrixaceae bacterium]
MAAPETLTLSADAAPDEGRPSLGYLASLDGLRGVAVAAVVAYHLGFGWAKGGYLGVSLFFTLSGYLISRLMVAEVHKTGRVDVGAFWRRRIKRLAPASLVTLTAIVVVEHINSTIWPTGGFRASMLGALLNVANWQALVSGNGYFDLLGVASPVRHYWSLAIEEQFYLLFPVAVFLLIRQGRKRIDSLLPVAVAGILVSLVLTLLLSSNAERVYLGTDTRMAEVLFGVLAGVLHERFGDRVTRPAFSLAPAALGVFLVAVVMLSAQSPIISHGGLIVGGAVWAVLIVGVAGQGPDVRIGLAGGLSASPLPFLGRISYALYLVHWPILQVFSQARLGTGRAATVAVQLAVSVGLASAITFGIERPIRQWRPTVRARVPLAWLAGTAVVAALVMIPLPSPEAEAGELGETITTVPGGAPVLAPSSVDFGTVIAGYGDSVGFTTAFVSSSWLTNNTSAELFIGNAALGCGTVIGVALQVAPGQPRMEPPTTCMDADDMARKVADEQTDVVIYQSEGIDLYDHEVDGAWTSLLDTEFEARYRQTLADKLDALASDGATVLVGNVPPTAPLDSNGVRVGENYERRVQVLDRIIAELADEREGVVVLDYAGAVALAEQQLLLRPDGVHPNTELGSGWVDAFMGPIYVDAQRRALEEREAGVPALG